MVENVTNSQPTPAKTPEVVKRPAIRQQLREFVIRYYSLLKLRPVEARETLEIYPEEGTKPQMEFVFDRKALRENPKAELITFNSAKLKELIDLVMEKGQVAKGFIPFAHDPVRDFQNDIRELIAYGDGPSKKIKTESDFLLNGRVELLHHTLKYAPFLIILLKISLKSIEPQEIIETVVIPVIDEKEITARDVNSYIEKVKAYLESPAPVITEDMPAQGDLLDFSDKKVEVALQNATQSILVSIEDRKKTLNVRLADRCRKEMEVIERYYREREQEISDKIASDDEKATDTKKSAAYRKQKKDSVPKLQDEVQQLREELEAKRNECMQIYTISTEFNVLAAAAIYIPADYHYTCKLTSVYGSVERDFYYDIFEQVVIPPTCDACGKPVYQGSLCSNLHLCCSTCGAPCKECQKQVCRSCDARTCRICGENLCKDHSRECARCKGRSVVNYWTCKDHIATCRACGGAICNWCATTCTVCKQRFCKEESSCSVECVVCHHAVCLTHAITCPSCGKFICTNDIRTCPSCHQTICVSHFTLPALKCDLCMNLSSVTFQKFRRDRSVGFEIPSQVGITPSMNKVYMKVGRSYYSVPKHLTKISMSSNKNLHIFRIPTLLDEYILVANKITGRQTLYRNPRVFGRVKERLTRKQQDLIFELREPAVKSSKIDFVAPELTLCPKCGKEGEKNIGVCPFCGAQLNGQPEA